MSDETKICYATIRETNGGQRPHSFLALNDDLECFEVGDSVVIITESEYERLRRLKRTKTRCARLFETSRSE